MLRDAKERSGLTPDSGDLLPTRQSLLERLRDWEDQDSWQEFFDSYWRLIYCVALKSGLEATEAEEVVQETLLSVAKAMKGFHYDPARGSFKGWLLQLTGWRISNQFKRRGAAQLSASEPPASDASDPQPPATFAMPPELEKLWDAEWEQNLLQTALARVRRQVNPRHLQIFDLCVLKGQPVAQVRRFLGVSAAEVYLAKHRVQRQVRREVERLREGGCPAGPGQAPANPEGPHGQARRP